MRSLPLTALLLAAPALAAPPPCSEGVFEVVGQACPADLRGCPRIVLDGGTVAFDDFCPPVEVHRRQTSRGTVLKAVWTSCTAAVGTVRLRALVSSGCRRMTGVIRIQDSRWRFKARAEQCATNIDCRPEAYCAARPGHCDDPGVCLARPDACTRELDPVCGCDGQTYPNACAAAADGVRVAARGRCPCHPILCPDGTRPVDGDGDGCPETCLAPCHEPCDCYLNPHLEFPRPCPLLCPSCDNYWVCEKGFCQDRCGPVPPGQGECPAPPSCATNAECAAADYCAKPLGECGGRGSCAPRPTACPDVYEPVCGCDHVTYSNRCDAAAAGVNVASLGPCPAVCGTIAGIPCPEGQFCEFEPGMCDGADLAGRCVDIPQLCPDLYRPVCGCDGTTYGNDCERRAKQAQKDHDGECRCPDLACQPGTVPRDTDGDGCPDRCVPACGSNADCPDGAWCAGPPGECRAPGVCEPRPGACPLYYAPVCGCDGHTYGNACEAAYFGVRVARHGPCFP